MMLAASQQPPDWITYPVVIVLVAGVLLGLLITYGRGGSGWKDD